MNDQRETTKIQKDPKKKKPSKATTDQSHVYLWWGQS